MQTQKGDMEALGLSVTYTWNQKSSDNTKLVIVLPSKEYSSQAPLLFYASRVYWEEGFDVLQFHFLTNEIEEEKLPIAMNEMIISFLREHDYKSIQFVSIGLSSTVVAYFLTHHIYPNVKAVWFSPFMHNNQVIQALLYRKNVGLIFLGEDREIVMEEEEQLLEEMSHLTVGYVNGNEVLDSFWVESSLDNLKSITKTIQQFIKKEKIALNEEKSKIRIYFTLYGDDFPLEEVTEKLGIEPTETCKKGDEMLPPNGKVNPNFRRYYPETSWKLDSGYIESIDVEKMFNQLIDQLFSKLFVINELREKYKLKSHIQVVPQIQNGEGPILTVNKKLINFAHQIQVEYIDYDMYIYPFDDTIRFEDQGISFKGRKL